MYPIPEHLIPILTMMDPTKDWEKASIARWTILLVEDATTIKYLPMGILDGAETARILRLFPEKAAEGEINWECLHGDEWVWLLAAQPQFSVHCDWAKLNGDQWDRLLRVCPQFGEYCDWKKLCGWDWSCLLRMQPQFHIHCDWEKLPDDAWIGLLEAFPHFAIYKK